MAKSKVFSVKIALFFLVFFFVVIPAHTQQAAGLSLDDTLRILESSGAGETGFRWDPFFSSGTFSAGSHEAAFTSARAGESGEVLFDHMEVLTLPLPYIEGGSIKFPESFVVQLKNIFSRYAEEDHSSFKIAAIIIDPGHGGRDSGAIGEHTLGGRTFKSIEKDITLEVSRQLHASLQAAFPDKRVLLTRSGDTYPTLEERVDLANSVPLGENEAAIYISVHANASFNTAARGYEVWYLSPGYRREVIDRSRYADSREVIPILNSMLEEELTTESILMARYILRSIEEAAGGRSLSRGLKAEEWFVVRNARMPSVLVELGFVSNEADALLMDDDAYLKKLSEALYKGITDFISFFERSGGLTALQ